MLDAVFLLETGWTQAEYEATDDILVQAMMELLNARAEAMKVN